MNLLSSSFRREVRWNFCFWTQRVHQNGVPLRPISLSSQFHKGLSFLDYLGPLCLGFRITLSTERVSDRVYIESVTRPRRHELPNGVMLAF